METAQIDGATRLYAIIGDPISSVLSPGVFNAMFSRKNINAVLLPLHVAAADLPVAWAGLKATRNFDGLIATMPHKRAMCALVDELSPTAALAGALNTVRRRADGRWEGDMFDGIGCVHGLEAQGHAVAGRQVFLAGAGGAGAAIAMAVAKAGAARLVITEVDAPRVNRVVEGVRSNYPATQVEIGSIADGPFDMAINATPLGMRSDDPLPFDPRLLAASTLIADVVNKPEITALLGLARESGHAIHSGRHLHHGQAIAAAAFFGFDLIN
jgi:shikimate dehydrogenase